MSGSHLKLKQPAGRAHGRGNMHADTAQATCSCGLCGQADVRRHASESPDSQRISVYLALSGSRQRPLRLLFDSRGSRSTFFLITERLEQSPQRRPPLSSVPLRLTAHPIILDIFRMVPLSTLTCHLRTPPSILYLSGLSLVQSPASSRSR